MAWVGSDPLSAQDDLVAIDVDGVARPLGVLARQAFADAAERDLEVVATPHRSVVLRHVPDAQPPSGSLIVGEIGSAARLHDLFAMLAHSQWCGELVVCTSEASRSIFVSGSCVVGASSNAGPERLGAVLTHYGEMTADEVDQTARAVEEGGRFGDAAVRLGFINRETLYRFMQHQVEMIVYGAMAVSVGTFSFFDGSDGVELPLLLNLSLSELLLEGARRMDEMGLFRRRIPSADHVPVRVDGRSVDASHEAYGLYLAVNGVRTVADLAVVIGQEEFATTRMLYQLVQGGAVAILNPRASGLAGALDAFNEAMAVIFGALVDNRSAGEDVRSSLASFATSSATYDDIFAGAGPSDDGTLDVARVLDNLASLPEESGALPGLLHEYVSFAIFIAEPALRTASGADVAEVSRRVAELLAPLAQDG